VEYKKLGEVYALRADRGEEVMSCLEKLAAAEHITAGKIEGLGAADYMKAGLYDVEKQEFICQEFHEPLEITALIGNISVMDGKPYLHVHVTAADKNQRAIGGHLKELRIGGTAEIFVTRLDGAIGRRTDDIGHTGLNIFDFS
jgi:predicted DNA-binding protein with PD1-like motif